MTTPNTSSPAAIVVAAFNQAGVLMASTSCSPDCSKVVAKDYRKHYPHVKTMSHEDFDELLEKELCERMGWQYTPNHQ